MAIAYSVRVDSVTQSPDGRVLLAYTGGVPPLDVPDGIGIDFRDFAEAKAYLGMPVEDIAPFLLRVMFLAWKESGARAQDFPKIAGKTLTLNIAANPLSITVEVG